MLDIQFPITRFTVQDDFSSKILIVEIRHSDIVDRLSKFGVEVSASLFSKMNNRGEEKIFTLYGDSEKFEKVLVFFPNEKDLFDDRSEIIRNNNKNVSYFPDGNIGDAFEIFTLASYVFNEYKTKKEENVRNFIVENGEELAILESQIPVLRSILIARNLVNMSPQDMNPETFSKAIINYPWENFQLEVLGNSELRETGCNLIRAVGKGSAKESFMIILSPKQENSLPKYGFVGKGVTFDAGGIQIKPDKAMLDMKCDMAGAAGMIGLAMILDEYEELPIFPVIAIGLVENMTGSAAFKPLDVYTAYNGTTVEIHHTDAEGRLVLADVMAYVEKNYQVEKLVTMATLTSACLHALGNDIAGVMGDDEEMIEKLLKNSSPYEPVWRLPLTEVNKKAVVSDIADIKNVSEGVYM